MLSAHSSSRAPDRLSARRRPLLLQSRGLCRRALHRVARGLQSPTSECRARRYAHPWRPAPVRRFQLCCTGSPPSYAATLATLAASPGAPAKVAIEARQLENSTALNWEPSSGSVAYYELLWRETTSFYWQFAQRVPVPAAGTGWPRLRHSSHIEGQRYLRRSRRRCCRPPQLGRCAVTVDSLPSTAWQEVNLRRDNPSGAKARPALGCLRHD